MATCKSARKTFAQNRTFFHVLVPCLNRCVEYRKDRTVCSSPGPWHKLDGLRNAAASPNAHSKQRHWSGDRQCRGQHPSDNMELSNLTKSLRCGWKLCMPLTNKSQLFFMCTSIKAWVKSTHTAALSSFPIPKTERTVFIQFRALH